MHPFDQEFLQPSVDQKFGLVQDQEMEVEVGSDSSGDEAEALTYERRRSRKE
jgi:hypothetical protein